MAFELPFPADQIDPKARYSVSARVESNGRLLFITDTIYPVILGYANRVSLSLVTVGKGD